MNNNQNEDNLRNSEQDQMIDAKEEMTVTLDLMDGTSITCAIVTILTVKEQDYIVLLPLDENG